MEVVLRGVRGGIATPALDNSFYGGNTVCVEVRTESGVRLFLDAGTGMREAWAAPPERGEAHVFISHGHADHIVGLWFFPPLHLPGWTTCLYLPEWLEALPDYFHQCGFFPVPLERLKGRVKRRLVKAGERLSLGPEAAQVYVEAFAAHHPGGGLGYRVQADNAVFLYSGDHEITAGEAARSATVDFLRGADLAVVDAQYNRADYQPGFGHSAWEDWTELGLRAGVGRLVLSHHDPTRSDQDLDKLDKSLWDLREEGNFHCQVAREGLRFSLGAGKDAPRHINQDDRLFQFLEELSGYRDENTMLDRILLKAREMTLADAGTIFLTEGRELVFAYTHNDSLFSVNEAHRHAYAALRLPFTQDSIAGYVATTGRPLNLPDVRAIHPGAPYRFNESLDQQTGFVTRSSLTLPFLDGAGQILGVMQLINSLDPRDRRPVPFTADMERYSRVLVRQVSGILERTAMERNGIYGILRMAAVHDPFETGPHAERVGAIAAEVYHAWAARRGHTPDAIRHEKSRLRLAAMLHDIGKVGISDLILKKPGRLTEEEFVIMRGHTEMGASILGEAPGEISALARDIARHHHQKWDGTGYAGSGEAGRLSGEEIPLGARITALADVFDALVSRRCYKEPCTFAWALDYLRTEAGRHFDPALVDSLDDAGDLLQLIYERFPDKKTADGPAG